MIAAEEPQQAAPIPKEEHTPAELLATTPEKASGNIALTTQEAVTKGLTGSKHPHTQKLLSVTRAQQALIDTQMHLSNFLSSLVSSINSSENSMEKTPLKQLFQEIHTQIAIL